MTSIEWLKEQIEQYILTYGNLPFNVLSNLTKQAKEMHKQEIVNAHLIGLIHPLEIEATKQAEQYYNETFKKD